MPFARDQSRECSQTTHQVAVVRGNMTARGCVRHRGAGILSGRILIGSEWAAQPLGSKLKLTRCAGTQHVLNFKKERDYGEAKETAVTESLVWVCVLAVLLATLKVVAPQQIWESRRRAFQWPSTRRPPSTATA